MWKRALFLSKPHSSPKYIVAQRRFLVNLFLSKDFTNIYYVMQCLFFIYYALLIIFRKEAVDRLQQSEKAKNVCEKFTEYLLIFFY